MTSFLFAKGITSGPRCNSGMSGGTSGSFHGTSAAPCGKLGRWTSMAVLCGAGGVRKR